jgi:hypothetical protein
MCHVASNRIMVGLPTLESRELIFHKLLSKENIENIDFKELGKMTEGYSGSDLKVRILILIFTSLWSFFVLLKLYFSRVFVWRPLIVLFESYFRKKNK